MRYFVNKKTGELNAVETIKDTGGASGLVSAHPHTFMEISERQYKTVMSFRDDYVDKINAYLP